MRWGIDGRQKWGRCEAESRQMTVAEADVKRKKISGEADVKLEF